MPSIATSHFPQYVFRNQKKLLWNPILKKAYADLPEERVRLQVVEYLLYEAGFSSSRVSFEAPVNLPKDKSASRTDLICFDKDFKPLLLVECKAPSIKLDQKVALQIGRYNSKIEAPYLCVSNGEDDFWFEASPTDKIVKIEIPEILRSNNSIERNFKYWSERGFTAKNAHPATRKWIVENCKSLYNHEDHTKVSYLKFEGSSDELCMPNYYRIFNYSDDRKLAVCFSGTAYGATRLNAVLNNMGQNVALLSCSLDLLADGDALNTTIQSMKGTKQIDISTKIDFKFESPITDLTSQLANILENSAEL